MTLLRTHRFSDFAPPPSKTSHPRCQKTLTAHVREAIADEIRQLTREYRQSLTHDQARAVAAKHGVRASAVEAIEGNDGYLAGFRDGAQARIPVHYIRALEVVARLAAELAASGLCREAVANRLKIPENDLRLAEAVVSKLLLERRLSEI